MLDDIFLLHIPYHLLITFNNIAGHHQSIGLYLTYERWQVEYDIWNFWKFWEQKPERQVWYLQWRFPIYTFLLHDLCFMYTVLSSCKLLSSPLNSLLCVVAFSRSQSEQVSCVSGTLHSVSPACLLQQYFLLEAVYGFSRNGLIEPRGIIKLS